MSNLAGMGFAFGFCKVLESVTHEGAIGAHYCYHHRSDMCVLQTE